MTITIPHWLLVALALAALLVNASVCIRLNKRSQRRGAELSAYQAHARWNADHGLPAPTPGAGERKPSSSEIRSVTITSAIARVIGGPNWNKRYP